MNLTNDQIMSYFSKQENSDLVKPELFDLYKLAVQSHVFNKDPFSSALERILVHKCILNSVYQIHIEVDLEKKLEFGIELQKYKELFQYFLDHKNHHKTKTSFHEFEFRRVKDIIVKQCNFSVYSVQVEYNTRKMLILFVVPTIIEDVSIFVKSIVSILKNSLLNEPLPEIQRCIPVFTQFKKHLQDSILQFKYEKHLNGVIAHFFIEDLKLYCNYMGEQFTGQIIKEISQTIQKYLKKNDLLYTINKRSFITYLPDCNIDVVSRRFRDVFFKIDPLLIKYQLDFYEVNPANVNNPDFYDKLLSSELRSFG